MACSEEYSKKFLLDYNFPPYSVGECKPIRGPGRREIGHGMLAERSLKAVIPPADAVPVHGPARLRDPGVERLVEHGVGLRRDAGAHGRRRADQAAGRRHLGRPRHGEGQVHVLLTDIQGDEDHYGDMDFKVAGHAEGRDRHSARHQARRHHRRRSSAARSNRRSEARLQILKTMLGDAAGPAEGDQPVRPAHGAR